MARTQRLYGNAAGRDGKRHMIRATEGSTFPRGICGDSIVLRDDPLLPHHTECRLVALTEVSLALEGLGLTDLAVLVTRHVGDLSFETKRAQVDADPEFAYPPRAPRR